MAKVTVLHNPRCSTSCAALEAADQLGVDVDVVPYLKQPLTEVEVLDLLAKLDGEPSELVRRDATFKALGLGDDDVDTPAKVARLLAENPGLMQRPVLIRGDRAVIGRPKDAVPAFLRP